MAESFNNATVILSSTTVTDIYQAPTNNAADRAIVLSCMVSNIDGTASADVTISITNAANTVLSTLVSTLQVPADGAIEIIPNKLVLKQSQKIRATASAANDLSITLSALEVTV